MLFVAFIGFLLSLCQGAIVVLLGLLLKNHFETSLGVIFQKPVSEIWIEPAERLKFLWIFKRIGFFLMIIGFGMMFMALLPLLMRHGFSSGRLNF